MTFQVRIQNLGKLADATVRVGPLTVLAGVNGTGKSFFSKALYSTLAAVIPSDHVRVALSPLVEDVADYLASEMDDHFPKRQGEQGKAFLRVRERVAEALSFAMKAAEGPAPLGYGAGGAFSHDGDAPRPDLVEAAGRLVAAFAEFKTSAEQYMEGETKARAEQAAEFLAQAERRVEQLREICSMSRNELVSKGIGLKVVQEMTENFQVRKIGELRQDDGDNLRIDLPGVVNFYFSGAGGGHTASEDGLRKFRHYSRVIFLESPALWRLKGVLESAMLEFRNGRTRSDVPGYFRALLAALLKEYSGRTPFPEIHRWLTGEVIGGKIVRNDLGELGFAESDGGIYPLSRTAAGVVNLGILALLIERKILDRGSFLFIDEPESNLHPEWQVAMTEALYALARGGVHVVLATHSVDILKRLEIYAKEKDTKDDAANLIAVNHFQRDGTVQNGGVEKIRAVKRDLSAPFFKLYKRGLS